MMTGSSASASSSSPATSPWPPRRPSKRSKLRNGTFIIPSTGERSRRQFTLRNSSFVSATSGSSPNGDDRDDRDDDDDLSVPSDYEEDEDDPQSFRRRYEASQVWIVDHLQQFRSWLNSPKGRGIVKCTVAYTIASLWTFCPPLSRLLGNRDGKHLVATITVYFHPARSAGSMIEASAIGIVAVFYAVLISTLSMASSVLFGSVLGWVTFGYAVVLFLFIGCAFGFIGWTKQKLNNPSVNVGCTLASLAIITVVTKENATYSSEFSTIKIVQVLKILVFGICTTSGVSLLLWRVSARNLLRISMGKASASLGDMLTSITHGFLSGSEEELVTSGEFQAALDAWSGSYAQMTKNLKEAKYEHYAVGHATLYQLEKSVYKSMETLAQSIGGLRSAANTQFELLRESAAAVAASNGELGNSPVRPGLVRSNSSFQRSGQIAVLSAIDEASDEDSDRQEQQQQKQQQQQDTPLLIGIEGSHHRTSSVGSSTIPATADRVRRDSTSTLRNSSDIFELFISLLGPSMKSLAYTLSSVLRDPPFGAAPNYTVSVNIHYRQSLEDALTLFNAARADALYELYKTIEFGRPRTEKIKADFEEVAAACGHFSFSLQAFGEEMVKYLDVLDDLKLISDHNRRSWRWMCFWQHPNVRYPAIVLPFDDATVSATAAAAAAAATTASGIGLSRSATVRPIRKSQLPRGIPDHMVHRRDTFAWQASPQSNTMMRSFAERSLQFFRFLMRDDIRFGIKVGIGAILWAMLAFTSTTRDLYTHWRGEWGLLSFMVVCSMTVGASNTTAIARFFSTLTGAACAVINWNLTQGHAVPLLFLGSAVAFCGFCVMIQLGKGPLGRTTLLAYNVISLYAYLLSQQVDDDDDDEGGIHPFIMEIAKHRFFAVTAGICWGLIVCRLVFPISARNRFKEGLSVLYLQMGLIWKRGPLAILLRSDCSRSYLRTGEQAALQRYATRLETLRQGAASEFELRGPFPYAAFGRIMAATNRVLDGFYAMSLLTQRRGRLTDGERALLYYTAPERAMLCDRICHVFQVLASSFMLEYPLTDALPSVDNVRDRLLAKIFQFRKEHTPSVTPMATPLPVEEEEESEQQEQEQQEQEQDIAASLTSAVAASVASGLTSPTNGSTTTTTENNFHVHNTALTSQVSALESDYALLYAYALVTGQVAEELKTIAREIEGLFGVLDEEAMLLQ